MADRDDDITFESTTDTADQIADGLGVELVPAATAETETVEAAAGDDHAEAADEGVEAEADASEPVVGEVTASPLKGTAPKTIRPKRQAPRNVNGAIAAVRREAEAKTKVAETERDAALARIAELTAGRPAQLPVAATPKPRATTAKVVSADDVPDTHPQVAALLTKITALGAKPKQGDFPEFEDFEEKRDTWIEERARLRARVDSVREDVARRESLANDEAQRAAEETTTAFEATEATARTRHADYDEKISAARTAGINVSDDVVTALLESPHGGELRYYLCANPGEVARINALSPHRQVVELGIIESRITASLPAEPKTPARPGARVTHAPAPQRNLVGDLPSVAKKRDLNDPTLTQPEYNRLRDEMDRESGRRVTH